LTECVCRFSGQVYDANTFMGAAKFEGDGGAGEGWRGFAKLLGEDLRRTARSQGRKQFEELGCGTRPIGLLLEGR